LFALSFSDRNQHLILLHLFFSDAVVNARQSNKDLVIHLNQVLAKVENSIEQLTARQAELEKSNTALL